MAKSVQLLQALRHGRKERRLERDTRQGPDCHRQHQRSRQELRPSFLLVFPRSRFARKTKKENERVYPRQIWTKQRMGRRC